MMRLCDPHLPGLEASLDVDGFVERLGRSLPECRNGLEIEEGRIFDVQYRPGREGLVLYRLKLRERSSGRSRRQYLSVRVLGRGQRPRRPSERVLAGYRALEDPALRTPYLELPDQELAAYAFPLDPVLRSLLPAFDPETMRHALQRLWRDRGVRVRRVTARSLGYTPQARAAIHYEVLSEARGSGVPEVRHLVGKIHAHKPAARLFAGAWALWRAAQLRVRLAPPVGFLGPLDLSLQEWVPGQRLGDLADTATFGKPVRQTARSLAVVHGLRVPAASRRTASKEAQSVTRWAGVLAALRPDHARRVESLRDRLAARLSSCARVTGTVHGDFHPANVLATEDHVTLIDVDQTALGDPLIDVGRFLASLRVSSLRVAGDAEFLRPAGESFLEQYLSHRDEDEGRARLFESACLLTAAATGFRLQRPGWEENAAVLLDEAERVLERAERGRVRSETAPRSDGRDDEEERRRWATDPVYVTATLAPHARERHGADLASCRVSPSGRSGGMRILRYRLDGVRGDARWTRHLQAWDGPRRVTRRALEDLGLVREALAGQPDAPALPEPVDGLPGLRLPVLEDPEGEPLPDRMDGPAGPGWGARVARALLTLHALRVPLRTERPLDRELESARTRAERLPGGGSADARRILARAGEAIRRTQTARAPALRRIRLDRVLCADRGVAFADVRDLAVSHPLLDAGELLARLWTLGAERGCEDAARAVADSFRATYADVCGAGPGALGAFEALALVRIGCERAERTPRDRIQRLLARADAALEGA